ncbi:MAG: hypothetical protein WCC41_01845, partial [Rhodomicrobium sp.]
MREFRKRAFKVKRGSSNIFDGLLRVPVNEKIPALNSILITHLRQPDWVCYGTKQEQLICNGFPMPRNKVQFQKGMSEAQFDKLYG